MEFVDRENVKQLCGIYAIENTVNSKKYIGQTRDHFNRRFKLHQWMLRTGVHDNPYLQKAFNKYGEDAFRFYVIEVIDRDSDTFNEREKLWIRHYKELGLAYNIQDGGDSNKGIILSEEARRIIGQKNREHMLGKKMSKETRQKMSQSQKARKRECPYDVELIHSIQKMLMEGRPFNYITETLGVEYGLVNRILSNNTWKNVSIEGWDEFQNTRTKNYRLTREQAEEIRGLYNEGYTVQELCDIYHKEIHTIYNIISYRTFK